MSLDSPPRKATPAEAGRIGAKKRWGEHGRILRLDKLEPAQRAVVLALLDATKAMPKPDGQS